MKNLGPSQKSLRHP